MKEYDVIIVGAGPAGIFAALELSSLSSAKVLMVEKGQDLERRKDPHSPRQSTLSGWGGAGAYSDGKLNLSSEVGGFLNRYLSAPELAQLIEQVDQIYLHFGAPSEIFGTDTEEVERIAKDARKFGLSLSPSRIRHLGTDICFQVLSRMRESLRGKLEVKFETQISEINLNSGGRFVLQSAGGERFLAHYLILAPGREGSAWVSGQAKRLHLSTAIHPVDIGLRVEVPASLMEPLTRATYEAKLIFQSKKFDDKVRTFCMCPYGEVIQEDLGGLYTVNGQSYAHRKTENTNFAILVSTTFTEPFKEPISYGKHIALLANLLGEKVIVQRLADLQRGRRSTPERIQSGAIVPTLPEATPGDLSFVLPYRYLTDILEMLEALDGLIPGIHSDRTLLYGVEVKFYSLQLKLSSSMEAEIPNLFGAGDGVGVSRGLVQASASGLIAAREIIRRMTGGRSGEFALGKACSSGGIEP
ncbi:MAG: FAD-dependent oxidoreductase [candidate division NC10 bacterium]|nr:FAD-dependent oxidoreductase [candidate division NC10 bacterium]